MKKILYSLFALLSCLSLMSQDLNYAVTLSGLNSVEFDFLGSVSVRDEKGSDQLVEKFTGSIAFDMKSGKFRVTTTYLNKASGRPVKTDVHSWDGERFILWRRIVNESSDVDRFYGPGQAIISDTFDRGSYYMLLVGLLNHPIINRPLFSGDVPFLKSTASSGDNWSSKDGVQYFDSSGMNMRLGFGENKLFEANYFTMKNSGERNLLHSIHGTNFRISDGKLLPLTVLATTHMQSSDTVTTYKFDIDPSTLAINSLESANLVAALPLGTQVNDNVSGQRYVVQPYSGEEYGIQVILDRIIEEANK